MKVSSNQHNENILNQLISAHTSTSVILHYLWRLTEEAFKWAFDVQPGLLHGGGLAQAVRRRHCNASEHTNYLAVTPSAEFPRSLNNSLCVAGGSETIVVNEMTLIRRMNHRKSKFNGTCGLSTHPNTNKHRHYITDFTNYSRSLEATGRVW